MMGDVDQQILFHEAFDSRLVRGSRNDPEGRRRDMDGRNENTGMVICGNEVLSKGTQLLNTHVAFIVEMDPDGTDIR